MQISVVIPTCNRKQRLLSLLQNLDQSSHPFLEIIIVDSGEEPLLPVDYSLFTNLAIQVIESEKSVCIQRNTGIQKARGQWIFLCDDDMEIPEDYIQKLVEHSRRYPEAIALSGLVLQEVGNKWEAGYPVRSAGMLIWNYIFQLSIWGKIQCRNNNIVIAAIKRYYQQKGNHLSKAGWPVITDFEGDYFLTPVYGLGASLVKKEWLLNSPFDEVLDKHGIGDNYGVALGFPAMAIHVLNTTFVYHRRGPVNRLQRPLQYFRRALALDYFIRSGRKPTHIKKYWFLWSLAGNFLGFLFVRDRIMLKPAFKSIWKTAWGNNPYYRAAKENRKVVEPLL